MSTVRLRREKQLKIDLAVLREERKWLTAQRDAIIARGYEKNPKFEELRAKARDEGWGMRDEKAHTPIPLTYAKKGEKS